MDSQPSLNNETEELSNPGGIGTSELITEQCSSPTGLPSDLTSNLSNEPFDSQQTDTASSPSLDHTNAINMDNSSTSTTEFVNPFMNHQLPATPFINLDSLFPANPPVSSDVNPSVPSDAHLIDSRILFNDRTSPTSVQPLNVANSTVDCSIVSNDSIIADGSIAKPKKRKRKGRKRKNPDATEDQPANASKDRTNLIDQTPDPSLIGPVAADTHVATQSTTQSASEGHQPPLINYEDCDDQNADDSSDSDWSSYVERKRATGHHSARPTNSHLSDSEFERYYSQENLYSNQDYFDNKRYRISVRRYGDEIRVFKPVCIVKRSQALLLNIIGLYCLDASKMRADQPAPAGFIWPLNFGKHEENVATIRRLIKDNPVDQLPYVDIDEAAIGPFSLDTDKLKHRTDQRMNSAGHVGDEEEEPDENDENSGEMELDRDDSDVEAGDSKCQSKGSKPAKAGSSQSGIRSSQSSIRPSHCPYCHQRFSASFNAKMHFKGRLKQSGKHISCPVSSKLLSDAIDLEPIVCTGTNCRECLKRKTYVRDSICSKRSPTNVLARRLARK